MSNSTVDITTANIYLCLR